MNKKKNNFFFLNQNPENVKKKIKIKNKSTDESNKKKLKIKSRDKKGILKILTKKN